MPSSTSTNTGTSPLRTIGLTRRREARGDGDHLVARLQAPIAELLRRQRRDRQQVRRRARVAEERVPDTDRLRELELEPLRVAARRQPEVERRVDEVEELVRVEDAAGDRDRRLARHERGAARTRRRGTRSTSSRICSRRPPPSARVSLIERPSEVRPCTTRSSRRGPSSRSCSGAPAEHRACLRRREHLVVDLADGRVEDDRLDASFSIRSRIAATSSSTVSGRLVAEVERARRRRPSGSTAVRQAAGTPATASRT